MTKKFYSLTVSSKEKTTETCSIIGFEIPDDLKEIFSYSQGQYLTLRIHLNGEEVRRSYSLCSSPLDKEWKIGVKKITDGKFSTFANDVLNVGDHIEVMPPDGRFTIPIDPEKAKNYVAFAAGSGITPILSIIKTHLSIEKKSTFCLFYTNQTVQSIILKEELEALKNQFMERFEIFHFLTRQNRAVPLFNGRLSEEKLDLIFKTIANIQHTDHFFTCGPEPLILMIKDYLEKNNVAKDKIHFELFGTNTKAQEKRQASIKDQFKGKACDVTIMEGGKSYNFIIEQGSDNILDAALNNDADMPYACKGGVCATCKAKLVEGKVDMLLDYGLEPEEKEKGFILTCQSLPVSEKVVVDYDI